MAGRVRPLGTKAALETPICEIVTVAEPVFVSVSLRLAELPRARLPKFKLAGEAAIVPLADIPEPLNATVALVDEL